MAGSGLDPARRSKSATSPLRDEMARSSGRMLDESYSRKSQFRESKRDTVGVSPQRAALIGMDLLGKIFLLLVEGPYKGLTTLTEIETKASKI